MLIALARLKKFGIIVTTVENNKTFTCTSFRSLQCSQSDLLSSSHTADHHLFSKRTDMKHVALEL